MYRIILGILKRRWILRSICKTIFFNFYYLPFNQAIYFPILLYKPKFLKLKGKITINNQSGKKVKFGMITFGRFTSPLFPNSGFQFYNEGHIIFNGGCKIGNDSSIVVSKDGVLTFGENFQATASFKINASYEIVFGKDVLVGYNSSFIDTDFHHVTPVNGQNMFKPFGRVFIGDGVWIGFNNVVLKNTIVPSKCIIASNSLLNKKYECAECSLLAGIPAVVKKENVAYLDHNDHVIDYNRNYD